MPLKAIAKLVKIPPSTVYDRVRNLSKKGIIKRYTIEIDSEKVGKPVSAYILISVDPAVIKAKKIINEFIDLKKKNKLIKYKLEYCRGPKRLQKRIKEITNNGDGIPFLLFIYSEEGGESKY